MEQFTDPRADQLVRGWIVAEGCRRVEELKGFSPEWLSPVTAEIFFHAREVEQKGRPANLITITQALMESGRLDFVGGPAVVVPGSDSWGVVESALESLRSCHARRAKAAIAEKLKDGVLSAEDASSALAALESPNAMLREEIELPRVNRILSDFARDVGAICSKNGVFLLDGVPVVLQPHSDRMEDLSADSFRTYVEKDCLFWRQIKTKKDDGKPDYVRGYESMGKMVAAAVLSSHDFRKQQRPLRMISRIELPILRPSGVLEWLGPGYDATSQILIEPLTPKKTTPTPTQATV
jgi:hypothetical protein